MMNNLLTHSLLKFLKKNQAVQEQTDMLQKENKEECNAHIEKERLKKVLTWLRNSHSSLSIDSTHIHHLHAEQCM